MITRYELWIPSVAGSHVFFAIVSMGIFYAVSCYYYSIKNNGLDVVAQLGNSIDVSRASRIGAFIFAETILFPFFAGFIVVALDGFF